jgi:hypothetical protein
LFVEVREAYARLLVGSDRLGEDAARFFVKNEDIVPDADAAIFPLFPTHYHVKQNSG